MTSIRDTGDVDIIQLHKNDTLSKAKLMIHHQFPGVVLVSPLYYSDNEAYHLSLDQRVDVGSTIQADFNIDFAQDESIGALMYKLQRKNTDQSDEDNIFNEEETCIQFFIVWKVNSSKEFYVVSFLIEHDKDRVWNRDGLMKLAERCKQFNMQHGLIEDTWLMRGNTVLMTRMNVTCEEECYKLKVIISETNIKDDTQKPLYIDVDR
jgi:hypothetical protein